MTKIGWNFKENTLLLEATKSLELMMIIKNKIQMHYSKHHFFNYTVRNS